MKRLILIALILVTSALALADDTVVRDVDAEGSAMIVGISAEQAQQLAVQSARRSAIEIAAGVRDRSVTIIKDTNLVLDILTSYSSGHVVAERDKQWDIRTYPSETPGKPPVVEYKVKMKVDVQVPEHKVEFGLESSLNRNNFESGDKVSLKVRVARRARIAVFNIMADDTVALLFPNQFTDEIDLDAGREITLPPANSIISLRVGTLPKHASDGEAVFVVAIDPAKQIAFKEFFGPSALPLTKFYEKYSRIADDCQESLLAYIVHEKQ